MLPICSVDGIYASHVLLVSKKHAAELWAGPSLTVHTRQDTTARTHGPVQ
jgi:hypothetical protein